MSNKKYYWLKLKENFFEDDTISWIEEQENGKEYCLFYLKLCLKSLKTEGILIRNVGKMLVPYDVKQLGKITNTDVDTVRVAMELFKNIGLIEILEGGEIYLNQLQNMVGSETSKAQLMRNKRARDKKILESGNNVTKELPSSYSSVENCYTELEKEKELEKELEIELQLEEENIAAANKIKSYFPSLEDEEVKKVIKTFKESKKDIEYLEEKLIRTQNTDCKSITGFLIKAIKENYKPHKSNVTAFKPRYKTGAGAGVNETFSQYTPEELEDLLKESQKGKF